MIINKNEFRPLSRDFEFETIETLPAIYNLDVGLNGNKLTQEVRLKVWETKARLRGSTLILRNDNY